MQYLYHVLSLREPVFIRPAELSGIQQVFFIKYQLSANNLTSKGEGLIWPGKSYKLASNE
jgi:hypothetical protein